MRNTLFNKLFLPLLLCCVCVFNTFTHAQEATPTEKPQPKFSGETSVSGESKRGNTKSTDLSGTLKLGLDTKHWLHQAKLTGVNKSSDDSRTDEEYIALLRSDYKLSHTRNYLFIRGEYEVDKFSGFRYEASISTGVGRKFIETDKHLLKADIGPGHRHSHLENTPRASSSASVVNTVEYQWKITTDSEFHQRFTNEWYEDGDKKDVWSGVSETAISTRLVSELFFKLSHEIKHKNRVPVPTEETDRTTLLSLSYKF